LTRRFDNFAGLCKFGGLMNIHDPALFSVVVPTYQGTRFLRRALDYFRRQDYAGSIVLADNSSGEHREYVAACARDYPDLDLHVHLYPADIRFLDKLVATLERIDSRFVMLHAHDDFMVPAAVERCTAFLAQHPEYSAARGRVAMIALSSGGGSDRIQASLVPHPMRAYEQDDPVERVLDHIERYAAAFYSVHERRQLIESFSLTERSTKNVIFFQYLSSCVSAFRGKIRCLDELFYVRQGHHDSWSGSLRKGDYEHWPMLITSPDFSRYYGEFRSALCALIASETTLATSEFGARIDSAATSLFRRGYCGTEPDNPEETRFLERVQNPASEENATVRGIVEFAAAYPDTI
jgi:glycosyltransferase domain-containing protein